jgi:hypothetical protein
VDRAAAERWVSELFAAWRTARPDRAAALFTPGAVYRANPFSEPYVGRDAIAAYWEAAVERQERLEVSVGDPIVEGDRVAVEWWVSLAEDGVDSVSTGALFLMFDGGLCASLREVWMERPGRRPPYGGWGS